MPGPGGNGTVNVTFAYAGTPWTATTTTPSITIDAPAGGSANGTVTFTAAPNTGTAARSGTLVVALKTITVTQAAVTTPQPPTGLFASSIVGNTLTLRFTPPATGPAPTGFVLEGGVNAGETLASIPTGSTAPLYTIDAPDGAFYVRMKTVTAAGTSGPSNEIRVFIRVPEAPSAPTNLLATVSGSSLALAWRNTSGGGVPTAMVLDVTGSFTGSLPIPLGDGASFDGVPSGTYTLALRAANSVGSSDASNAVTISIPSACSGAPLTADQLRRHQNRERAEVVLGSGRERAGADRASSSPSLARSTARSRCRRERSAPRLGRARTTSRCRRRNACGVERADERADGDGAVRQKVKVEL